VFLAQDTTVDGVGFSSVEVVSTDESDGNSSLLGKLNGLLNSVSKRIFKSNNSEENLAIEDSFDKVLGCEAESSLFELIEFVDAHFNVGESNWAHGKLGHFLLHYLNKNIVFFVFIKASSFTVHVELLVAFWYNHFWGSLNVDTNRISVVFLGNSDH
jgi:hypothetical protein